jgi:hypothetical protein
MAWKLPCGDRPNIGNSSSPYLDTDPPSYSLVKPSLPEFEHTARLVRASRTAGRYIAYMLMVIAYRNERLKDRKIVMAAIIWSQLHVSTSPVHTHRLPFTLFFADLLRSSYGGVPG